MIINTTKTLPLKILNRKNVALKLLLWRNTKEVVTNHIHKIYFSQESVNILFHNDLHSQYEIDNNMLLSLKKKLK